MSDIVEKLTKLNTTASFFALGSRLPEEAAATITALRAKLAEAEREREEKFSVSVTVGGGLSVYGTMEAIGRVQDYILLDSKHPVEREDVRRSLAKALQATETKLAEAERENEKLHEVILAADLKVSATPKTCAHFGGLPARCLINERTWSEDITPKRCDNCPDHRGERKMFNSELEIKSYEFLKNMGYSWQHGGKEVDSSAPARVQLIHWMAAFIQYFRKREEDLEREIEQLQRELNGLKDKRKKLEGVLDKALEP